MSSSGPPIFVLCYARSGSTLMRYVLDSHPRVCAPPETHSLLAVRQLVWLFTHTAATPAAPLSAEARDDFAIARARAVLDAAMADYVTRCGKERWADKSVSSIDYLGLLDKIYPDARLLCLHRSPFDTMASCLEALQSRQGQFGFEPFVARTPGRPLDGLADYWLDKTRRLLACERERPRRSHRVVYEALVTTPAEVLASMFAFLGLEWEDGMIDKVFASPHVIGPGDGKILRTSRIESGSIGHGSRLAATAVSPERRRELEALAAEIGNEAAPVGEAS